MLNYIKRNKFILVGGTILAVIIFIALIFNIKKTFAENSVALSEEDEEVETVEATALKFVTVFDNNERKTVKTDATTVAEVLDRLKISLSASDSTDPSLDSEINASNFFINIYRSRPVLISDGLSSKIVLASSFDPKSVFKTAGITVYDGDEISLETNPNFLESGISEVYKIKRNGGRTITVEEEIAFNEKTEKTYDLNPGEEKVIQLGELGKKEKVYKVLYLDGEEVERELVEENILREPVDRIVAVGAEKISEKPLTAGMGRNYYTTANLAGETVERQETYYDLPMSGVMSFCGKSSYSVRDDGAKVDEDGYVLVAANLSRYPRCSIVQTSLGAGKVYDTGGFAASNPEQFDLATDWSNHDGR